MSEAKNLAMAISIANKNRRSPDRTSQASERPTEKSPTENSRSPAIFPGASSIVKSIMEKKMAKGGLVEGGDEDLFEDEIEPEEESFDDVFADEPEDPETSRKDLIGKIMREMSSK